MTVKWKKPAALFLAMAILFAMDAPALAAENSVTAAADENNPVIMLVNTASVDAELSFSGRKGTCTARVAGYTGSEEITATVTLKRENSDGTYTTIKTWSDLDATGTLTFSKTRYVTKGYTYRLTITATVSLNGTSETITTYSEAYAE